MPGVCVCTFLPILLWNYVWHFHLRAIYPQIPSSPSTSLSFTQSMEYTAPLGTAQVCLTGFCISQIFGHTIPDYSIARSLGSTRKYQPRTSVVYFQSVYPTSGNTEPNKWSWIRPYRCHLEEDPRHHTMVGIVLS